MGISFGSFLSGFCQIVGKILHHPLDFLSGKSCNSICGSTWDLLCYIENFCVARLLKFAAVTVLFYFVLVFFYLLYNLGICQCICRAVRVCFATYFSALHFFCTCLCYKLRKVKRERNTRERDIEDEYRLGESSSFKLPKNYEHGMLQFSRRRIYKHDHLRRSLRPSTHRAHLKISGNSVHLQRKKILKNFDSHASPLQHHIRVTRTSKFLQKGRRQRTEVRHWER